MFRTSYSKRIGYRMHEAWGDEVFSTFDNAKHRRAIGS